MKLKLGVVASGGKRFDHEVQGMDLIVGRSSRAQLSLPDRSLSREHARFFFVSDAWYVEDLGSHNGTHVNDQRISGPRRLKNGDTIAVGDSILVAAMGTGVLTELAHTGDSTIYRSARELLTPPSEKDPNEAMRRLLERMALLNEVNHALARSISLEELLELILDKAFTHFRPREAAVFLRDSFGQDVCAARRASPGRESRPLHSRSLLHEVIDKGMAACVVDTSLDQRFAEAASLLSAGVRTLIAAPLLDPQGTLGMIVLGSSLGERPFCPEDLELLVSLASVAALRIRNVRLVAEALERQRLEQELRLARTIQLALLPPGGAGPGGYDVHGGNIPSRGVSGDFYKLTARKGGAEFVFFVADVSGKGIAAALLTASLEALVSVPIEGGEPVAAICDLVSGLLFERTPPEKYATAFMGVLEPETGRLQYVNAGHNSPLLVRAGGEVVELRATGLPLGLFPGARYSTAEAEVGKGDLVLVYTDGITEATNSRDEEYGLGRLLDVAKTHRGLTAAEFARVIEQDTDEFVKGESYADDRTMVIVRRLP